MYSRFNRNVFLLISVSPSGTSYPDSFSFRKVQIAITADSWADKLPHCINQSVYSLRAVIDAMSKINHSMLYNIDSKIFYKLVNCIKYSTKNICMTFQSVACDQLTHVNSTCTINKADEVTWNSYLNDPDCLSIGQAISGPLVE